jgi:sulfite reductase (NADPH) hemoprotein beta-component
MYAYGATDTRIVLDRVRQYRVQTDRFLAGELSEDQFKPLRLQNGLYIQRHAPMLRVAIPYGILSTRQLRALAAIARRYDRSWGHFTTRQNIQFNWVKLEQVPYLLEDLAHVGMHAIQTSGNCIRNVTTDPLAGVARDELVDVRPYAELMRQWSTLHPEFAHLPRKFKVAFSGAREDRAALRVHDLAFEGHPAPDGSALFRVLVGGGQGRTPRLASEIRSDLPWQDLLTYTEAVLRTYNRFGRRDNIYKARIKILVEALGADAFAREVESEFIHLKGGPNTLDDGHLARTLVHFRAPPYLPPAEADADLSAARLSDPRFNAFVRHNTTPHQKQGYLAVALSLKRDGSAPGDVTADEMETAADLADRFGFGEVRVSHRQNLVLPDVARKDVHALWQAASAIGLGTSNVDLATDVIACPGGDFCSLANAKSIPLARDIQDAVAGREEALGALTINISGCINACGHHHVGHIGVLGVDKGGEEFFQLLVGGNAGRRAMLGTILGKAMTAAEIPGAITRVLDAATDAARPGERFIEIVERIGIDPFRKAVYPETESV